MSYTCRMYVPCGICSVYMQCVYAVCCVICVCAVYEPCVCAVLCMLRATVCPFACAMFMCRLFGCRLCVCRFYVLYAMRTGVLVYAVCR